MKDLLLVDRIISLNDATKIFQLFKQKKHQNKGYFFELIELQDNSFCERLMYAKYKPLTQLYRLKVYRTVP